MGKGENASYQHFLLFPQYFQASCSWLVKVTLVLLTINSFPNNPPAFSPFPTMCSTISKTQIITLATFTLSSANAFNLVKSKISLFRKELRVFLNPFLHMYSFYHIEEKNFKKTSWKKVKLLKMSNFTFFHNVFYAYCMLKSFNSHISVFVCTFFNPFAHNDTF